MEKRVLLAVILSLAVWYGYLAIFPPPKPVQPAESAQPAPHPSAAPTASQTQQSPTTALEAPTPAAQPLVADASERDIIVENESIRAVFSTRGGVLKSWRLKKYQDAHRQPLEIVPQDAPPGTMRPFALTVDDPKLSLALTQAMFRPSADALDLRNGPASLTFEYADANGLKASKQLSFHPSNPYVVYVSARVTQGSTPVVPTIQWGPALGNALDVNSGGYNQPPRAILNRNNDVDRVNVKDIAEVANSEGVFGFAGVDDHYFMTAAVLLKEPIRLHFEPVPMPIRAGAKNPPPPYIAWSVRTNNQPSSLAFFVGPKDFDVLTAVDRNLNRAIDFGMFAFLVSPLLRTLKWIHVYVGNYGWSIVLLTVLINLVMFPLRHKSVISMRRMQEIQPEVKALQDRYAHLKMTDPARQKMNTEMMALYKERGVNPASGCVPILLTLPVLFAFYAMLSVAIELRGAPFIGWIKDLSVYDPLFITPILMGMTQFVQTKMTPTSADPTQQKVMLIMPLMFMFMFIWAPSGLVLYWTVSNLWAIGQQLLTNRLIGPPQVRTVRPPAERQVKTAGAGRTEKALKERR